MAAPERKKIYYGWFIVFSCFMIMCFGLCVVMNCTGLFVKPVSEALGISRQAFSLNTTLASVAMMVVSPFAGKIYARFGLKRVMVIASIGLTGSYMCYSIAPNITVMYGVSVLVGFFLALIAQIPSSMLVTRWFNEKRGLAMGLVYMGSGVGGVLLNPIIGILITRVGWRITYLALGILMLVFIVPCTLFLIRSEPGELGLEPYGGKVQLVAGQGENDGVFLGEAKGDPRFWVWLFIVCVTTGSCSAIVQQLTSYVSDIGYSYTVGANVSAVSLGLLAVGKVLLGRLFDGMGTRKTCFLSVGCVLLSCVFLTMASSVYMLMAFLPLFGLGCAITTVAYPIVTTELFGKKDYGSIFGIVSVANSLGTAMGSPVAASIYDRTGSYVFAWYLFIGLFAIDIFAFLFIFRRTAKLRETAVV